RQYDLLISPGEATATPLFAALLHAHSSSELAAVGRPDGLDTDPPTDDRPYFFQLARPSLLFRSSALIDTGGILSGNARAMRFVLLTLAIALVVGVVLLGPTPF